MGRGIKIVTRLTDTVAINNAAPADRFPVGWGVTQPGDDDLKIIQARVAQGRKKTPIGRGTLQRKR